jgi:maltose O-acetyltransferase
MQTEREKMLAGEPYDALDKELSDLRIKARKLTNEFNGTAPAPESKRREIINVLFGKAGPKILIEPPFRCDYGKNIEVAGEFYVNFGCVILDCALVKIGRHVLLGPNVHIYTATHPIDPKQRMDDVEMALPVTIGDNVWVGGGSIINPGVTIGENSVIGSGSVVTKDIPANVVAVGNPCRVIKKLK